MTVDFIFESLNQFFPAFAGNSLFLVLSMLIPIGALLGFITVYGFGVIYSEIKVSSFMQDKTGPCLLYTSPSPRDTSSSRMPSSA